MKSETRANNYKGLLALLFLVATLALAAGGYLYYRNQMKAVRRSNFSELHAIGGLKAKQISDWRRDLYGAARLNSSGHFVRASVVQWLNGRGNDALKSKILARMKTMREAGSLENVMLTDKEGRLLFAVAPLPDGLSRYAQKLAARAAAKNAVAGDFYLCPSCKKAHFDVAAPILGDNNRPVAALMLRADLDGYLYPLIQSWPIPSRTAETLLVRRDGDDALFLNRLRHSTSPPLTVRIPMARADVPAVRAVSGASGVFDGRDYRGVDVLSDIHHVPGSPWYIVSKIDKDEISAEARYRSSATFIIVILLILICGTLAVMAHMDRKKYIYKNELRAERRRGEMNEEIRATFYGIGDGVIAADTAGRVTRMNPVAETLTGWTESEALGKPLETVFKIVNEETGKPADIPVYRVLREGVIVGLANHTALISRDGTTRPIADSGAPIRNAGGEITGVVLVFRDQKEQKRYDDERDTSLKLLKILNDRTPIRDMLRDITGMLHRWTGCEAVGIRLKDGGDYPYYETHGFAQEFVKAENSLCSRDEDGNTLLDSEGAPLLECMCGNILCGRFDPAKSFFTDKGSFWSNCTTELLATTSDADRQARTRNRCNAVGYESVALVRMRSGNETIGLLQFNDRSIGRFTPELLSFLENVADQVAIAVAQRQAQESLKEKEGRYRSLFENLLNGFAYCKMIFDGERPEDFVYLEVNSAFEQLTGIKGAAGKKVSEVIPGIRESDPEIFEIYGRVATTGAPERLEGYVTALDMWFSISVYCPEKGYFVAIFDVITERKKAEKTLRESEEKFRRLFNASPDSILLIDETGRILDCNDATLEMGGYGREEIVGKSVSEMEGMVLPEDMPLMLAKFSEMITQHKLMVFEHRAVRKSGEVRWMETRASVIQKEGAPMRLRTISRDITEHKLAEEKQARLAAAIEQSGEVIVVTDPEATIQYVNPAFEKVTGYTYQEAVGRCARLLKSGKQDDAFYKDLWETISSGKTWKGNFVNKKKDGSLYSEEASISPVFDAGGNIVNYVAVKSDMTEYIRMHKEMDLLESQLLQAQKMEAVGRLAGGVAHDFNNMLAVIIGTADMALMNLDPSDPMHGELREILSAANRSADLTRQLLAFARKQIVSPVALNLNDAVSGMLKMLRRLIGEDIDLLWKPGAAVWNVKIDPAQVDQIMANLIVNARDAIEENGKITVETHNSAIDEYYCSMHPGSEPGEYVMLAMSDNGCGIEKHIIDKIFEPFFTTKESGKGSGLGLATVYGIVKQNNGFINIYSEEGKGTTLKIYLPRFHEDAAEDSNRGGAENMPSGTETALIVEDEPAILNLAKRILEGLGYKALTAASPEEAIVLAREFEGDIHLLLTDVVMPGFSGRELAERLNASRPDMKRLYMSGYTANVIAHHGVLEEGVMFVQKPFSVSALARKVREVLDGA